MRHLPLIIIIIFVNIATSISWADTPKLPWSKGISTAPFPDSLPALGHLRVPFSRMDETSPPYPSCFYADGLCGYVNYLGETVIAPEFHKVEQFKADLARVSRDGLFGFVDRAGGTVLPIAYTYLSNPHNGAVMARENGKTVLLTLEGERLFETTRDFAFLLAENHVLLGSHWYSLGRPETELYQMGISPIGGQIMNIETGETIDLPDGPTRTHTTDHGVVVVIGGDRQNPAYLFNAVGQIIAGPFERINSYSYGLFPAQLGGRWGAINAHGEVLIDFQFDSLGSFSSEDHKDWAVFSQNGKFGYIDTDGLIQVPAQFDRAYGFDDDVASVILDGIEIDIARDGERPDACNTTPLIARSDDFKEYRLLSPTRVPLNDVVYRYARTSCGDPTLVSLNGEYFLLNDDGTRLDSQTYPRATPFRGGVALVYVSDTHGTVIDASGAHLFAPVPIRAKISSYWGATINPGPAYVKLTRKVAEQLMVDPSLLTVPDPNALPEGTCLRDGVRILERYRNRQVQQAYYYANGVPFLSGTLDYAGCFGDQTAWVGIASKQGFCQINREGAFAPSKCDCHEPAVLMDAAYDYPNGYSCYERGLWAMRGSRDGRSLPTINQF